MERIERYFRVRLASKADPFLLQRLAQLSIVVNLAVEDQDAESVIGYERLVAPLAQVDDAQAGMTEPYAVAAPDSQVIGPAVSNFGEHGPKRVVDAIFRVANAADDAAHGWVFP